jgi:hypothetical protein
MEKKRCKVVMLPTDKTDGTLWKTTIGQLIHTHLSGEYKEKYQPFNLYIISDDKIEEDDWVIETSNNNALEQFADYSLNQKSMGCKKIIATTDSELIMTCRGCSIDNIEGIPLHQSGCKESAIILPQISQSFIKEYCRKGGIDEVDVKYEKYHDGNFINDGKTREFTALLRPKVNSDNTINIHPIKDTYTRDEVEQLCVSAYEDGFYEGTKKDSPCKDPIFWLKENL